MTFATDRGPLQAVRGVDLQIHAGAVLGVVGESGSGKSVTALALVRLLPPHARATAGRLRFRGEDVTAMRPADLRRLRGGHVGMIFQEPARSFDPIYSIERSLAETLRAHAPDLQDEAARDHSVRLLEEVGIAEAARRLGSFPHQFSGGMLQRVMIAHALAAGPELLIADEPTTALDVTVQAQVVELLLRLRAARGLAILFISHDLALVSQVADRILVMYGGLVMEQGPAALVMSEPRHPYTRALLEAHLELGVHYTDRPLRTIPGTVPDPLHPEPGCPFAPRCALAEARCADAIPPLVDERAGGPDIAVDFTLRHRCVLPGVKPGAVVAGPVKRRLHADAGGRQQAVRPEGRLLRGRQAARAGGAGGELSHRRRRDLRPGRRVGQRQDHHRPPGGGHVPARQRRHHLPRPRRGRAPRSAGRRPVRGASSAPVWRTCSRTPPAP